MRSRPKAASSRIDRCSSAASLTPVAPAPTMTQWSWPGRSGAVCALARRRVLTMRRLKRAASRLGVEGDGVLGGARGVEIIGDAAGRR